MLAGWGDAADRRAGRARSRRRRRSMATARRCSGSARACSASRPAATCSARSALLPAATGNLAKPGAGFLYLNGGGRRGIDGDYIEAPHLRQGERRKVSHMDLATMLSDPGKAQALITWNINIAASNPDQARSASGCCARASVPRRDRPLPDRHDRLSPISCCRPRASWSSTTSCRSYFHLSMSRAGEGAGADGRGAAEPGDLPPAGARDGLRRAGTVRG